MASKAMTASSASAKGKPQGKKLGNKLGALGLWGLVCFCVAMGLTVLAVRVWPDKVVEPPVVQGGDPVDDLPVIADNQLVPVPQPKFAEGIAADYYTIIDKGTMVASVYARGETGFRGVVYQFPIACGSDVQTGFFVVGERAEWKQLGDYHTPHYMALAGTTGQANTSLHGCFYRSPSAYDIIPASFNQVGEQPSMGLGVSMYAVAAEWLEDMLVGQIVPVEIVESPALSAQDQPKKQALLHGLLAETAIKDPTDSMPDETPQTPLPPPTARPSQSPTAAPSSNPWTPAPSPTPRVPTPTPVEVETPRPTPTPTPTPDETQDPDPTFEPTSTLIAETLPPDPATPDPDPTPDEPTPAG